VGLHIKENRLMLFGDSGSVVNAIPLQTYLNRFVHSSNMHPPIRCISMFSNLSCPECGYSESIEMPDDQCIFFHECGGCKTILRPKEGDCCVFCSYGDIACPLDLSLGIDRFRHRYKRLLVYKYQRQNDRHYPS